MTTGPHAAPSLEELATRWQAAVGTVFGISEHRADGPVLTAYADLFGYSAPRFHSVEAARAEGFRGLVAPAGYAGVYTMQAVLVALHAPDLDVPFARNLHAGQSLDFGEPVCDGDVVTTTVTLRGVAPRGANLFYAFDTSSRNARGELCASGVSTQVVRFW